jgi:hypothetical protein
MREEYEWVVVPVVEQGMMKLIMLERGISRYSTASHCEIQYSKVLHSTAQHSTAWHSMAVRRTSYLVPPKEIIQIEYGKHCLRSGLCIGLFTHSILFGQFLLSLQFFLFSRVDVQRHGNSIHHVTVNVHRLCTCVRMCV